MPIDPPSGPDDIPVPQGRDRLGRAHQLRVDIAITVAIAPAWLRRALGEKDPIKARSARVELVERIAQAIERRFRIMWIGSDDEGANARPVDDAAPLFGGPQTPCSSLESRVGKDKPLEHNMNI